MPGSGGERNNIIYISADFFYFIFTFRSKIFVKSVCSKHSFSFPEQINAHFSFSSLSFLLPDFVCEPTPSQHTTSIMSIVSNIFLPIDRVNGNYLINGNMIYTKTIVMVMICVKQSLHKSVFQQQVVL